MSVLIKGMKMPKEGCKDCPLVKRGNVFDICPFLKREVNGNVERGGKPYDCPLIELPDHGDLIDMDEFSRAMYHEAFEVDSKMQKWESGCWIRYKMFEILRDSAPVVIPAERSEDA